LTHSQITLLLSIYEHLSSQVNWDAIDLPEGRSKIACQRVLTRMLAQKEGGVSGAAQADKSGGTSMKTSKAPVGSRAKKADKRAANEAKEKEPEATKGRKGHGKKRGGDNEDVKPVTKRAKVESDNEDEE